MNGPFKLLLIGDSDSQLLACEALCRFPSELNIQVTINAIPREGTPDSILQRAAALGDLWRLDMGQLLTHPALRHFDAIGVYLTGSKISDFRLALGLLPSRERPLLFCGFNGVVLEKFMEGMSWRLGYDLVCLSGLGIVKRWTECWKEVRLPVNARFSPACTAKTSQMISSSSDNRGASSLCSRDRWSCLQNPQTVRRCCGFWRIWHGVPRTGRC